MLPPLLPKKDGICGKCGSKLYQRTEDADVSMIKKRLSVYENQSKPVIDYYKGKIPFVHIHMNRPPEEVVKKIVEELKKINLV